MKLFIGLDIGSTSVKAVAADSRGRIICRGKCAYPTVSDSTGKAVQNAHEWIRAASSAVRQASEGHEREIAGIGLSSQGGSILAVDRMGEPLCDVLTVDGFVARSEAC